MTALPSDVEIDRYDRVENAIDAELELANGDAPAEITVTGEAVFTEEYYRRDDRGSLAVETGESRTVELFDGDGIRVTGDGRTIPVRIPLPRDLLSDSTYRNGVLELTLTLENPHGEESAIVTTDDTPITLGRPTFAIDPGETRQRIDGFGASGAWWAHYVGGWEETRESIADLLFSKTEGIGLSIYRYNAMGGVMPEISNEWRTGETYDVGDGEYDWSRDENGRWMVRAAADRGVETLIMFTKTPPARLTKNNKTYADDGADSNLHPENYDQFARYLADITAHFRAEEGVDFDWVSPINEPEWDWDEPRQEGTPYTVSQIVELSTTILETFEEEGIQADLLLPEAGAWEFVYGDDREYADRLLGDPVLGENLPVLAAHSYWSSDEERRAAGQAMAEYPDTRLWQTEWCEMVPDRDLGMDFALNLASTVHADLTIANASSWQFWLAVSKVDYRDGLLYVDTDTRELTPSQALWAFGNYTRFVRPGSVRIGVESNYGGEPAWKNDSGVALSAYLGPAEDELVVVAIHELESPTTVTLAVESSRSELTLTPHRTSEDESLETLEEIRLDAGDGDTLEGEVTLAPRSVTTFTASLDE